jgi:hypothetical protein
MPMVAGIALPPPDELGGTPLWRAAVPVGAFDDDAVARTLLLGPGELPRCLLPVGWSRGAR